MINMSLRVVIEVLLIDFKLRLEWFDFVVELDK
jgi:hypothetical protein